MLTLDGRNRYCDCMAIVIISKRTTKTTAPAGRPRRLMR
jgi:hypothetical protein